jgi:hypothetical protein
MHNNPNAKHNTVNVAVKGNERERQTPLNEGYRLMASDREREAEADEWAEGLIIDAD